ncbi:MAG: branched-chain amino acid ABC transporter permease [Thalassobaculaceae bacterium]|nr:branched-chain amino acid ABC transporter permease [Thalassobaculaceae bacterium]
MDFLYELLVQPFADMIFEPLFFIETVVKGLMAGVLYSLVALGFVLIFKASGVFNFAQGTMALFAALTLTGLMEKLDLGMPHWMLVILCLALTVVVMIVLAVVVERFVLRPLVNQELIILFMATLGLSYVLEGVGDLAWGSDVKVLDLGLPEGVWDIGGVFVEQLDVIAAVAAGGMVAVLAVFFSKTRIGRALRAVADDHQAALSVGISLQQIWVIVWSVAGLVALVAGVMWGSKSGVQFSLSLIALKALPVLILGGFTSIPGAIIGGLIIGVGEKVAEVFWYHIHGGAVENWFAYMLALVFLMFRPQGLFGDKIIERV